MKKIPDMIFRYNSNSRYKLKYGVKNSKKVVKLYYLDESDIVWEHFDYFEDEDMSKNEIIQESKELINLWQGEPENTLNHITEVN